MRYAGCMQKGTTMIRKTIFVSALAALTLSSAACNTVQGLGQDIESVGREGEEIISQAPAESQQEQDAQAVR